MPEKADDKPGPGRPRKKEVRVEFVLGSTAADYLLAVGKKYDWGDSVHAVCKALVMSRYIELHTTLFHEKAMPGVVPEGESGPGQ